MNNIRTRSKRAGSRKAFRSQLLSWYDRQARDLPWRDNRDPYRVWLSEIMLQQTRVSAVIQHYQRFLLRFPTLETLAAARLPSVLAAWSGLGYYRRARMLHAAAREIVQKHASRFPDRALDLRALPGIGRYTAAAVASIAFEEPVAVVDGNVERVIARLNGEPPAGEASWEAAQQLLDPQRPGDFNQALMELGATICTPKHPDCPACPVRRLCATRGELPRVASKPRQKKREIFFALDSRRGSIYLVKRPEDISLMPGMWDLPEIDPGDEPRSILFSLRHSITVTDYTVRITATSVCARPSGKWVPQSRLAAIPLTGLARKILRAADIL